MTTPDRPALDLDAIEARAATLNPDYYGLAAYDVPALVAEVRALRAENDEAVEDYRSVEDELRGAALVIKTALARIDAALALCDEAGVNAFTMRAIRAALSPQETPNE